MVSVSKRTAPGGPALSDPIARPSQLASFIAKFDPPIARLIRSVRAALRKRLPTAVEMVYDNYNFFVIGYGANERASEAILSIAAHAKGVALVFIQGKKLPDPTGILRGEGNQVRSIQLVSASDLSKPAVEALIKAAVKNSKTPFAKTGKIQTVIKSVSKKQRPRSAKKDNA